MAAKREAKLWATTRTLAHGWILSWRVGRMVWLRLYVSRRFGPPILENRYARIRGDLIFFPSYELRNDRLHAVWVAVRLVYPTPSSDEIAAASAS